MGLHATLPGVNFQTGGMQQSAVAGPEYSMCSLQTAILFHVAFLSILGYENVGVHPTPATRTPTPPMRVENLHQDYSRLKY